VAALSRVLPGRLGGSGGADGKAKRLQAADAVRTGSSGRTRLLGGLAAGAVLAVFGAEVTRIWRLGKLPRGRGEEEAEKPLGQVRVAVLTIRDGYAVSRTRENPLFNMLAGFTVCFAITRGITTHIREHGGLGPLNDVVVGDRHIHHFVPGGLISLASGGVAIGWKKTHNNRYLAIPFGVGVALVLDESALLLELDDVYWTEEGVLSVQIAFAAIAMLSALAYLIRMLRHAEGQDSESDWELAAKAWDDLQMIPGGEPGIGGGAPGIGG
jgi:hypothetical protein